MNIIIALNTQQLITVAREFRFDNFGTQTLFAYQPNTDTPPKATLVLNTFKGLMVYEGARTHISHFVPVLRKISHDFNKFKILKIETDEPWLAFWETQERFITERAHEGNVIKQLKKPETIAIDIKKIAERFGLTQAIELLREKNFPKLNAGFSPNNIQFARMLASYEDRQKNGAKSVQTHAGLSEGVVAAVRDVVKKFETVPATNIAAHNKSYDAYYNGHVRQYGRPPAGSPDPKEIVLGMVAPGYHGMTMFSDKFSEMIQSVNSVYDMAKEKEVATA